jgi:glycosyltransferase involved in cell wall biosynthesis
MSEIYSAADLYVIPSLHDNQPNTVLESMACGTPVAGFDVGGVREMVRPGVCGVLAGVGDISGLRAAIVDILQCSEKRAAMGVACRRTILEEYRLETQCRRYIELYERELGARRSNVGTVGHRRAI